MSEARKVPQSAPPAAREASAAVTSEQRAARREIAAWLDEGRPPVTDAELEAARREWRED